MSKKMNFSSNITQSCLQLHEKPFNTTALMLDRSTANKVVTVVSLHLLTAYS